MCPNKKLEQIHISSISMEELENIYNDTGQKLNWDCLFVLPFWLKNWWQVFGAGKKLAILAVRSDTSSIICLAPFMIEENTAKFIGSESVCDYQDIIIADKFPDDLFLLLLEHLKKMGVSRIEFGALHPDSKALTGFSQAAKKSGYHSSYDEAEKFYKLDLPKTWEEYLNVLDGKQRHEIRRKIRRLNETGQIDYQIVNNKEAVKDAFDEFLSLFQTSRKDKAEFLTDRMNSFFTSLAKTMAEHDMLQLGFLRVDGRVAAATLCFEYGNTVFLYNNGYNPEFRNLSAGLLGKIFSIKHNIEKKIACYNFLKGDEAYKKRLGGQPLPLYRLTIELK